VDLYTETQVLPQPVFKTTYSLILGFIIWYISMLKSPLGEEMSDLPLPASSRLSMI
jgi:hypothetical protein